MRLLFGRESIPNQLAVREGPAEIDVTWPEIQSRFWYKVLANLSVNSELFWYKVLANFSWVLHVITWVLNPSWSRHVLVEFSTTLANRLTIDYWMEETFPVGSVILEVNYCLRWGDRNLGKIPSLLGVGPGIIDTQIGSFNLTAFNWIHPFEASQLPVTCRGNVMPSIPSQPWRYGDRMVTWAVAGRRVGLIPSRGACLAKMHIILTCLKSMEGSLHILCMFDFSQREPKMKKYPPSETIIDLCFFHGKFLDSWDVLCASGSTIPNS